MATNTSTTRMIAPMAPRGLRLANLALVLSAGTIALNI